MEKFISGDYDKIELIYNQFKMPQRKLFKRSNSTIGSSTIRFDNFGWRLYFEPSKEEIMTLIPKSLKTQLYKAIRDSFASEHGARMTAMHKATDNATDLRNELKLTYNKARQASITNEILEIVGGAEALNG
jgi:F-type H+-transporting ATPase subunit gamma